MQLESFYHTQFCVQNSVLPLFIYKIHISFSWQEVKLAAISSFKAEFTNLQHRLPWIAGWYM